MANTGYGYGETEGVELSERLMQLFAERLDGSVTVGEALLFAKQTYVGTRQAEYGPFDEKVLQQATFYGLPIYRVGVTNVPDPEPIPPIPNLAPLYRVPNLDGRTPSRPSRTFQFGSTTPAAPALRRSLGADDPGTTRQQSTPFSPDPANRQLRRKRGRTRTTAERRLQWPRVRSSPNCGRGTFRTSSRTSQNRSLILSGTNRSPRSPTSGRSRPSSFRTTAPRRGPASS